MPQERQQGCFTVPFCLLRPQENEEERGHLALRQGARRPLHPCFLAGSSRLCNGPDNSSGLSSSDNSTISGWPTPTPERKKCGGARPALRHTFFSHIVWGAGSNVART